METTRRDLSAAYGFVSTAGALTKGSVTADYSGFEAGSFSSYAPKRTLTVDPDGAAEALPVDEGIQAVSAATYAPGARGLSVKAGSIESTTINTEGTFGSRPAQESINKPDALLDEDQVSTHEKQAAKAHMTTVVRQMATPLVAITLSRAIEIGISLQAIEWTVFRFRDFRQTDLIFRVTVDATPAQALSFWDYLGEALDAWRDRLPAAKAEVLQDKISLEVLWRTRGPHAF